MKEKTFTGIYRWAGNYTRASRCDCETICRPASGYYSEPHRQSGFVLRG
jgi:hypothetical protein